MNDAITWLGVVLIAIATLGGAAFAVRHAQRRELCFGAAAGALLAIAGVHLLPDAWSDAQENGVPVAAVPLAAVAAFALSGWLTERGCTCAQDRQAAGGIGTAVALAGHRLLEGAALAVAGSATVLIALVTHAFAEGLAAGALLTAATRRRQAGWLAVLCLSPAAGVAITGVGLPDQLTPLLVAAAAGVLSQAARIGLVAAFSSRDTSAATPAAALVGAGLITTLAVFAVG